MSFRLDGMDEAAVASFCVVPRVVLLDEVSSTMDEAHCLAESGAPNGTVVIANRQLAGRGRFGRRWTSEPGLGLWMTVLRRDVEVTGLDVLSLRIGLRLAAVLDPFSDERVTVKWPNDLLVRRKKLAGILVEARWREAAIEWAAIGIGVNLIAPADQPGAIGLRTGTRRIDLVRAIIGQVAEACMVPGEFADHELMAFSSRDAAAGELLSEPGRGRAAGVTSNGALIVETPAGRELFRRGSLVFASEAG